MSQKLPAAPGPGGTVCAAPGLQASGCTPHPDAACLPVTCPCKAVRDSRRPPARPAQCTAGLRGAGTHPAPPHLPAPRTALVSGTCRGHARAAQASSDAGPTAAGPRRPGCLQPHGPPQGRAPIARGSASLLRATGSHVRLPPTSPADPRLTHATPIGAFPGADGDADAAPPAPESAPSPVPASAAGPARTGLGWP